jgi:hypothetical protein
VIVRCLANRASEIGPFKRGLFYLPHTQLDVVVDQTYRVYGMTLFRNAELAASMEQKPEWFPAQAGIAILICPLVHASGILRPDWLPLELFSVEDPQVPDHWEFGSSMQYGSNAFASTGVEAIWGYHELVHSVEHFNGLINREPAALDVFRCELLRQEPPGT